VTDKPEQTSTTTNTTSQDRPSYGSRRPGGSTGGRPGGRPSGGGRRPGGGGRKYRGRPRICQFCTEKVTSLDHKKVELFRRYVTEQGKIRNRRETGTCAKHQRMLARSVKRARHLALLPFAADRLR
jgi:small subunit ribosomal protein S18